MITSSDPGKRGVDLARQRDRGARVLFADDHQRRALYFLQAGRSG